MNDWIANPRGHEWEKNEDGSINIFALDIGHHNGPRCIKCGYSFCEHCQTSPIEPCLEAQP